MRFSTRSKVSMLVSLLVIMSAFMLSGLIFRAAPTHAAGTQHFNATKGILTQSTTVDSTQQPTHTFQRGVRPIKPLGHIHQGAHLSGAGLATPNAGVLLSNFNGVSSRNSAITNFGAEFGLMNRL